MKLKLNQVFDKGMLPGVRNNSERGLVIGINCKYFNIDPKGQKGESVRATITHNYHNDFCIWNA